MTLSERTKTIIRVLSWIVRMTLWVVIMRWVYLETGTANVLVVSLCVAWFEVLGARARLQKNINVIIADSIEKHNEILETLTARTTRVATTLDALTSVVMSNTTHVQKCQIVDAINRVCLMPVCPYEEKAKKRRED